MPRKSSIDNLGALSAFTCSHLDIRISLTKSGSAYVKSRVICSCLCSWTKNISFMALMKGLLY